MSDKNFMSYGDAEPLFAEIGSELGKRVEQYSTMPSASSTLLNKIVQYIGDTSESYINGFFYKCVYNEDEADYEWIKIDMGGGITIAATLLASGWDANNQQTIIFDGYSSSMNGVIGVPTSATSAQKTAYAEAIINVVNQVEDSFTFEAVNVPSIDLPVVVYAGGGSGSGGTTVVANPEGAATANLSKLQIDETIYQIVGGGSSGGITPLDTEIRTEWNVDYELADSIANYDLILIQMYFTGEENNWTGTRLFYVDTLRSHNGIWIDGGNNDRALHVSFTDDTHYRITTGNYYNGIHGIYGINIGAGSGGSVVSEIIEIQSGDDTTSRTFTFERVPEKIFVSYNSTDNWYGFWSFIWGDEYAVFAAHPKGVSGTGNSGGIGSISYGSDGKSFTITGGNAFQAWNMVGGYGQMFVEYSGNTGGASAVSDLTDVELDNLSDGQILQYNSTTQKWENVDNQGGGSSGSGFEQTLLWDYVTDNNNSVLWGTFNATLHDNINNYDMILVENASYSADASDTSWNATNQFIVSVDALNNSYNNNYLNYTSYYDRSSRYYIKDTTFQKTIDNKGSTNGLVKVYGLKFSGGSGSGQYSETELFSQPYGEFPNTITLSDDYTNYDQFCFYLYKEDDSNYYDQFCSILTKAQLDNVANSVISGRSNSLVFFGWQPVNGQWVRYSVDNARTLTRIAGNGAWGIGKITGIKLSGSGGGTGGASAISDLTDVELTDLQNGQILQYNSTTQKWENADNQGGSGSGYSKTNLWKGEQTTSAELQLSEAITNYDIIEFVCGFNNIDKAHMSFTYDVQQFLIDFPYAANPTNTTPHFLLCVYDNAYFRVISGSSDDKIYVWDLSEHSNPTKLYEINGIKLGSGNGSESEFSADVLFDGSGATSLQSSITLTAPWSNYDAIAVVTIEYYQNREYKHTNGIILKEVLQNALDTSASGGGWIDLNSMSSAEYAFAKVESTTNFTNIYGGTTTIHIDKVYGLTFGGGVGSSSSNHEIVQTRNTRMQDNLVVTINLEKKYTNPYVFAVNAVPKTSWGGLVVVNQSATITYDDTNNTLSFSVYTNSAQNYDVDWLVFDLDGSGGGTDVEANPTGTPTAELNSIRIGQDIYKIAGGESSGSGFEQTVLWDYETDNEGSVLFGLATATLHDAIENYDALLIDVVSVSSDMTDATWKSTFQFHIDVKALSESFNPNYILCESAANRTSRYYIQGTTLQKTSQATDNTNGLVRVYGLKFGGGSNGAFTDEVIFENTESTNPSTITLSNAYTEYDEIVIKYTRPSNEGDYTWHHTYLVEALPLNSKIELTGWHPDGQYLHYTLTNETTLTLYNQGGGVIIREIHGLKFGGSSSERKYSFTNLWTGSQSTAGEITLNDNIENYDLIQFICQISNGGCSVDTFDTNYFLTEFPYKANPTANDKHYCPSTWDNTYARVITGTSTNKLYTWDFTNYQRITAVNGIKLGGGTGTVDTAMSDTSTNAVQNKAIKKYIDDAIAEFVDLTTSDIDDIINDVFGS